MMSASEGGGGSWKSRRSKLGCVNSYPNAGRGAEGVKKSEKFEDIISGSSLCIFALFVVKSDTGCVTNYVNWSRIP